MRVSECAQILIEDINLDDGTIFIRPVNSSRKNKSRVVRIGQASLKAVKKYIQSRGKVFKTDPIISDDRKQTDGPPMH